MAVLFGRDKSVIGKNVRNVFSEGELPHKGFRQILPKTSALGGRPTTLYNLDVVISVGYRVKSLEGVRFRQWATQILRELLLNRMDELRRIAKLERRVDAVEGDVRQIKSGVNYLIQQLSAPPDPPRRRIGFGSDDAPAKPYGRL